MRQWMTEIRGVKSCNYKIVVIHIKECDVPGVRGTLIGGREEGSGEERSGEGEEKKNKRE